MSRVARINSSLVALLIGQILQIVTQVVVTPLFLTQWGANTYGSWITISALVTYLAYADAGITAYAFPRLMKNYASENWTEFAREFHSAGATILGLVGLAVVLGGLTAAVLFVVDLEQETLVAGVLLGAQALLQLLQSYCALPYSIVNKAQRAYANAAVYGAVILAGTLVVLLVGGGRVGLAATLLAIAACRLGFTIADARRVAPRVRFGFSGAHWPTMRSLVPHSIERSLASIATLLGQQGTLLAISATLGVHSVAALSTTRTLVNFSRMPSGMLINAVYAEFTDLYVRKNHATAALLLRVVAAITIALTYPVLGVLVVAGPDVYTLWTRGTIPVEQTTLVLLCIEAFVLVPLYTVRTALLSSNQHRTSVWVECGTVFAVIGATLVDARWWGIAAVPGSVLVLQAPLLAAVIGREVERVLEHAWKFSMLIRMSLKGAVLGGLCALLCYGLSSVIENPLVRVAVGLAGAALIGVLGLFIWLIDAADRKVISDRGTRAFPWLRGVFLRWSAR